MNTPHIVIIGGGLAGLATAYELSKTNACTITILEQRHYPGGRVYSENVAGTPVDFGGFIIYPWYHNYHRLMRELKLTDLLEPLPLDTIYYQIDASGHYYKSGTIPFSKKDTALLAVQLAKSVIQTRDIAEPPLDVFDRLSPAAYFRQLLHRPEHAGLYETYMDTINQGYCYPPASESRLTFMAPFIYQTYIHGDVKTASFIRSGNNQLPLALATAIQQAGHTIQYNTTVTDPKNISADAIVFAQNVSGPLYTALLPKQPLFSYTHYYAVAIRVNTVPTIANAQQWGGVFYKPNTAALQITSALNLGVVYSDQLTGYILLYVVVRSTKPEDEPHPWQNNQLYQALRAECAQLWPMVTVDEITNVVYWSHTMPCATEEYVEAIRTQQGKNGYYFVGDWLGAPSMETALTTGQRTAERILHDITQ